MVGNSEAMIIKQRYREAEKKGYWSIQREREPVKLRQMPGGWV